MWQQDMETMEKSELEQIQLERLQATINRVSRNVPLYKQRFAELDIDPDQFFSLKDLGRLPFTTRKDLAEHYPYGLFAVPLRDVVRLHSPSGSGGASTVCGYTGTDVRNWANLAARVMCAAGIGKDDLLQIAFDYGLRTGGLGLHYGAERIGASVIPASGGNSRRQIRIMQDYRSTALACTPSYALHLADVMDEMGVKANDLHLRYGLFGGERFSASMRAEIEQRLNLNATDNYGVSEVMGPGIAGECAYKQGLHVNEDHFLVEIIDPLTLEPQAEGETGEVVITTLSREAFPLLRFRTGDLSRILPGRCACGRTFRRLENISGRCDGLITIRGITVAPEQIGAVLELFETPRPYHHIIVESGPDRLDQITVAVEAAGGLLRDSMREAQEMLVRLRKALAEHMGLRFEVRLVGRTSLKRREPEEPFRVIDRRTE